MSEAALKIRGLQKSYKHFKLGPLDLTVPQGSIYGLIGPNAAGKTTTIDMIMGMGPKGAGSVSVFGLDHMEHEVAIKQRIGFVSPDLSYRLWKKVNRLVHFTKQFYPTWDDRYCQHLMEKLQIGWDDKIAAMSFGTRIKLGLLIALSHKPDLLLLDEPTIGVDAVSKKQIFTELLAAVQNEKRTVLISSHGLTDIERFADHIGMIKNGKIVLEGHTADMIEPYRMMDFIYENRGEPNLDGLFMQERSANRFRALIDVRCGVKERLQSMGAREISEAPVTLEELFVGLTLAKEA